MRIGARNYSTHPTGQRACRQPANFIVAGHEELLLRDIESFFLALAPPERPWLHNDLHLRQGIPPDEPRNAHAHLIAMLLGNQLSLPVVDGRLGIGRWQSVLLVELDGPRQREVLLQLIDTGGPSPPTGSDSMLGSAP